jgi:hypothetical protein
MAPRLRLWDYKAIDNASELINPGWLIRCIGAIGVCIGCGF